MTANITRNRWELYREESPAPELPTISSRLIIGPVQKHWITYTDPLPCKAVENSFGIVAVDFQGYYDMADDGEWTLCLIGEKVRLHLKLPVYGFVIEVADLVSKQNSS